VGDYYMLSLLYCADAGIDILILLFVSVARNPEAECNPFLGKEDTLGVLIGVTITLISLAYTGWSYTADSAMGNSNSEEPAETAAAAPTEGRSKVGGIVTNDENYGSTDDGEEVRDEVDAADIPDTFSNNWKLNVVLGTVSCWFSMAITAWGSIEDEGDAANPQVGKVSMWIIIGSQWLCLTLYLWTLVAPRLFPDRDFS